METTSANVNYAIYIGSWVNWSRGRVFGATLTLTRDQGNLLIAFTALSVAFISGRFWRIACLAFHRAYSSPDARDALHHQRQVILRNSATAGGSFWTFGQLLWTWARHGRSRTGQTEKMGDTKKTARSPLLRILPTIGAAALCFCFFAIAGGFSSQISTAIGDEVLIVGTNCSLLEPFDVFGGSDDELLGSFDGHYSKLGSNAATYAQQCYSNGQGGSSAASVFDCNSFVVPRLPNTAVYNASCPFKNDICQSNSSNLVLDTGYIDTHLHLGLNAPEDERFMFRQVYTCAPLRTDGFTTEIQGDSETYTRYNYGKAMIISTLDYTFEVNNLQSQYLRQTGDNIQWFQGVQPRLVTMELFRRNGTLVNGFDFFPIPELDNSDSDLSLVFFIGNGVLFWGPSQDDWYKATIFLDSFQTGNLSETSNKTHDIYIPQDAASPMACMGQWQFCRASLPSESRCTQLGSFFDAGIEAVSLFAPKGNSGSGNGSDSSSPTRNRFLWFMGLIGAAGNGPSGLIKTLGTKALLSQQTLRNGFQSQLFINQWKQDAQFWWHTWLASLQLVFAETANGLRDPALDRLRVFPKTQEDRDMCQNQKIQSRQHTSFSIFGLAFVFVTGAVIVILSYTLEPLFNYLDKRRHATSAPGHHRKDLEWTANDTLHLQSLGFRGLGRGTWSRFSHTVPITEPDEVLEPFMFDDDLMDNKKISMVSTPSLSDGSGTRTSHDFGRFVALQRQVSVQSLSSSGTIGFDKATGQAYRDENPLLPPQPVSPVSPLVSSAKIGMLKTRKDSGPISW